MEIITHICFMLKIINLKETSLYFKSAERKRNKSWLKQPKKLEVKYSPFRIYILQTFIGTIILNGVSSSNLLTPLTSNPIEMSPWGLLHGWARHLRHISINHDKLGPVQLEIASTGPRGRIGNGVSSDRGTAVAVPIADLEGNGAWGHKEKHL